MSVVLAGALALLGLGVLLYLWYAAALSRLFPRLGVAAWRGWVPVLNEAELLRLGGYPSWAVVFLLVPIVNLCGVVLRGIAAHRISVGFGRGAGATALAVLLPPVWATLLVVAPRRRTPALVSPDAASRFAPDAPGGQEPHSEPGRPAASVVHGPPAALAAPTPTQPPANVIAPAPVAEVEPEPVQASAAVMVQPPIVAPSIDPRRIGDVSELGQLDLDETVVRAPVVIEPPDPLEDESDATVVIDRRPAVRWELATDDGEVCELGGASVVLGRRPTGTDAGTQYLALPDNTRTLSKVHARLDLHGEAWRIIDLGSTNGVVVLDDDGTEHLLDAGGASPLDGRRFLLGKVGMRVRKAGETT